MSKYIRFLLELLFIYSSNFLVIHLDDFSEYAYQLEIETISLFLKHSDGYDYVFFLNAVLIIFKLFLFIFIFYRGQYWVKILLATIVTGIYVYLYINVDVWLMSVDKQGMVLIILSYLLLLTYAIANALSRKRERNITS